MVGPRLRRFRIEAGLSQKELAARCQERGLDMTRGTLAKIECQARFIEACELFIVAKVLKIALERFFPSRYGERKPGAPGK